MGDKRQIINKWTRKEMISDCIIVNIMKKIKQCILLARSRRGLTYSRC